MTRTLIRLALLALGILPVCAAADPVAPADEPATGALIEFHIDDQRGGRHTAAGFTGRPLLVLWGDRKGIEFMKGWSPLLTYFLAAIPDSTRPERLDVAHTRGAPFFVKGKIKKRMRNEWDGPVLLDWEGRFREAYGCPADSCTALLFDAVGRLVERWTIGEPDPPTAEKIAEAASKTASVSR